MNKALTIDFRDAFFEELFKIAKNDSRVILLMADQGAQSFKKFEDEIPNQIINVGSAEQNMIGTAAGLALSGKKVFVHAIANFASLRCYEQIKVDLSIMNIPVVIVGVGAGLAYSSDGPTHHANQDLAALRAIPGLNIYNASDSFSLTKFSHIGYKSKSPVYIRFDKGNYPQLYNRKSQSFQSGFAVLKKGEGLLLISTGVMVHTLIDISNQLEKDGISAGVIDVYRLKPISKNGLKKQFSKYNIIISIEEHIDSGGLGSIIGELIAENNHKVRFKKFSLGDKNLFIYGSREYLLKKVHLDVQYLIRKIKEFIR